MAAGAAGWAGARFLVGHDDRVDEMTAGAADPGNR